MNIKEKKEEEEEDGDFISCDNCKLKIASQNYVMHTAHCARHIEVCKKCGEPIPRGKLSDHEATEHVREDCLLCGKSFEKSAIDGHVKNDCVKRLISCVYCDLDLPFNEMTEHVEYCGTRTDKCDECGEFVMVKYRELHLDSNHKFLKLDEESGPGASWEVDKARKPPIAKFNLQDKVDATLLPCEFCDGMFTPRELRRHQVSCDNGWSTTIPILRRLSIVECKICKKSVASQDYENHLIVCDESDNPNGNTKAGKNGDEIPCLLCKEPISFDEYDRHYSRCSKNVKQPSSSSFSSSSSSLSQRRKQQTLSSSSSNDICQMCKEFIKSEDFLRIRHGVNCMPKNLRRPCVAYPSSLSSSSSSKDSAANLKLPCEFCLKSFYPETLNAHQISCSQQSIGQRNTFIPCEICGELKTINEFNEHQINCRVKNLY